MNLAEMLGVKVVEDKPDRYVLHTPVTALMLQPHGVLHGGISAYLAEHAASECTTAHTDVNEVHALGVDLVSTHLAPVFEGDTIETVATPIRNGGRLRVWRINQYRLSDGVEFNTSQLTLYLKRVDNQATASAPSK